MSNVIEFSIKALDNFTATMGKFGSGLDTVEGKLKAAAAAAGVYAAVRLAKVSLDNAEAMGTAAMKANMTVEAYSALAWAAKMSNTEVGSMATGMKFLNRALSENASPEAAAALKALGVSTKDPTEALLQLADKFYVAKDGADKTATAMAIFGRSGVDMVPLLNQGSGAIKQMMTDAEALGVVISGDFAAAANQVNDNLETLGAVVSGTVNKTMQQLAPTLEALTGQMIGFALEGGNTTRIAETLAAGMKVLVTVGLFIAEVFRVAGTVLGGFLAAISLAANGEFSAALATMNSKVEFNMKNITAVWDNSATSTAAAEARRITALRNSGKALDTYTAAEEEAAKKAAERYRANEKIVEDMQLAAATYGFTEGQVKMYTLALNGATAAQIALAAEAYNATLAQEEELTTMQHLSTMIAEQQKQLGTVSKQVAGIMFNAFNSLNKGIGDAVGDSLVYGKSLQGGMEALAKQIVASMISAFIQVQIAGVVSGTAVNTAWLPWTLAVLAIAAGIYLLKEAVERFGPVGVAIGLAVSAAWWPVSAVVLAATAAVLVLKRSFEKFGGVAVFLMPVIVAFEAIKGVVEVLRSIVREVIDLFRKLFDIGGGGLLLGGLDRVLAVIRSVLDAIRAVVDTVSKIGNVGGNIVSGGIDFVGDAISGVGDMLGFAGGGYTGAGARAGGVDGRGGFPAILHPNETVIDHERGGGYGGMVIQNLTIHVLENATNTDAFKNMNKIELRNALGQPVVDALNEMFTIGVRPNFAMVNR